jgi:phage gp36-like protein
VKYGVIGAGSSAWLKARVSDATETPLETADVVSITRAIDGGTPAEVTVADVWQDTLGSWELDSIGYNFAESVNAFPTAATIYTVVYAITTATGSLNLTFEVRTLDETSVPGYCDRGDIEDQFGVANVGKWADLENHNDDAMISARIDAAIAWAKQEIDDRLRGRYYEIPFSPAPATIVRIAATLAGVWLYESRGVQDFDEATGKPNHKLAWAKDQADKLLVDIVSGKRRLDASCAGTGVRAPFRV